MIEWNLFEQTVTDVLNRNISADSNPNQNDAISANLNHPIFLVAGPGSGKTTVIALRVLKLIFVDSVEPSSIMATTFTRKAAAELRSRILGWGDQLRQSFLTERLDEEVITHLKSTDLNQIITGTLDSIIEEGLTEHRPPATPPPIVIENFVSRALMIREGLFKNGRYKRDELKEYLRQFQPWLPSLNAICNLVIMIKDRMYHDRIDVNAYLHDCQHPGAELVFDAINDYNQTLQDRMLFDFSSLENTFLERLEDGTLASFVNNIKFLLIDEYQDTNLLQENIYFNIIENISNNGGSVTIVGDDDQSLYRFRGATVNLFQNLRERFIQRTGIDMQIIFLSNNYRSTDNIINFCNDFITLDAAYQNSRVVNKPLIRYSRTDQNINFPILGMFRPNVTELSRDLTDFINQVVNEDGYVVTDGNGQEFTVKINPEGNAADIAILSYSPREHDYRDDPRLPLLLSHDLQSTNPPIEVFNPRGEAFERTMAVSVLCGLILECIDPRNNIQNSIETLPNPVITRLNIWRNIARAYIATNPPQTNRSLQNFVNAWQNKTTERNRTWPSEYSLMDLIYKLITWIPPMQNDIEGLVYLEGIARTINQTGVYTTFKGNIVSGVWEEASVREAIRNVFSPIASGSIDINEELLETLPPGRVNIMSIHQSKGLEFPLVIVDVGSDIRDKRASRRRRYPNSGTSGALLEDELRPYSPLGVDQRAAADRAFDDLIRLYFEAYSRSRDAILLIGLNSVRWRVEHVATGWNRDNQMVWGHGLPNLLHI